MKTKTYWVIAPFYLLGSLLSLICLLIFAYVVISQWIEGMPADTGGVLIVALIALIGISVFLYIQRRAIGWIRVSEQKLRLLNGIGVTMLTLDTYKNNGEVVITRRNETFFDGPRVAETSLPLKLSGFLIRGFLILFTRDYIYKYAYSEDFILIGVRQAPSGVAVKRAIFPDVYSWNRSAYAAMNGWLKDRSIATECDPQVQWEDGGVHRKGFVILAYACSIPIVILGLFIYMHYWA